MTRDLQDPGAARGKPFVSEAPHGFSGRRWLLRPDYTDSRQCRVSVPHGASQQSAPQPASQELRNDPTDASEAEKSADAADDSEDEKIGRNGG